MASIWNTCADRINSSEGRCMNSTLFYGSLCLDPSIDSGEHLGGLPTHPPERWQNEPNHDCYLVFLILGDWSSLVKQAILPCNVLRDCCDNLPWGESLCDSVPLYQMIWRGMTMNVSAMLLHSNKALCLFRVTSLLTHKNENGTQHIGQWCKLLRCMRDVLWCIRNTLWSSCGIVPAWWELFVYAMPILWHWSYREFAVARVWAWQTR
jgi:hypothetical protein